MNIYPGHELMHHPDLQVDLSDMEPLIRPESLKELENEYLKVSSLQSADFNANFSKSLIFCRLWRKITKIG